MTISTPYPYTLLNGTTADATQVMANFNQIQNDVNANAANNGANNNITSLTGLTTPVAPGSGGTVVYVASTATNVGNAFTVATAVPGNWSNNQGNILEWIPNATNTAGTATMTTNAKTTKNIKKLNTVGTVIDVAAGDIVINVQSVLFYDGTQYILLDPVGGIQTNATLKQDGSGNLTTSLFTESAIASAATTDLGTAASNIVAISGVAAISSFGSSASTASPLYFFRMTGASSLTYNAVSMILEGGANITCAAGDTGIALYLGSGNWKVLNYTRLAGKVQRVIKQVFSGSGTYTPTPGMVYCIAKGVGGGGGGGGANGVAALGAGGGGGGFSEVILTAAQIGASQAVTIGAAGIAGTNTGTNGGNGGDTSLGALLVAKGGTGGTGSVAAASGAAAERAGGAGGVPGTGDIAAPGPNGGMSYDSGGFFSGAGANSMYGQGALPNILFPNNGTAATGNGAGGSGGCGAGFTGGVGTAGILHITEFCV